MPADDQSEHFYWVDENDTVLGSISRSEAHNGTKKIHRAVGVFLLTPDRQQMLMQQRSALKDTQPNKWTYALGGHITFGDTADTTAIRELQEELGVSATQPIFLRKTLIETSLEKEMLYLYEGLIPRSFALQLDPLEVQNTQWIAVTKLPSFVRTQAIAESVEEELQIAGYI